MNARILDVINAVIYYQRWYCVDSNIRGIFPEDWYEKTFEYYKSLPLPKEMKKNKTDFDAVLAYKGSKDLEILNNTPFFNLNRFNWKNF